MKIFVCEFSFMVYDVIKIVDLGWQEKQVLVGVVLLICIGQDVDGWVSCCQIVQFIGLEMFIVVVCINLLIVVCWLVEFEELMLCLVIGWNVYMVFLFVLVGEEVV